MTMNFELKQYTAPSWASSVLHSVPKHKIEMARLPTPIQRWHLPDLPEGIDLYIKRDDITGMQLSGNKIRKLEFIFADVLKNNHDSVITLGGIQSNHARATAVGARYLGLDSHLILRTSRTIIDQDPGLDGNLMIERLVGAHIHLVTKEEYSSIGQKKLGESLLRQLKTKTPGSNPYLIPVGGSSALGTWGYIELIQEIISQQQQQQQHNDNNDSTTTTTNTTTTTDDDTTSCIEFTDICMACGSGGTTAGVILGAHLAPPLKNTNVHAYMVCDDESYFIQYINTLFQELGATPEALGGHDASTLCRFVQAKGYGYAISKDEELQTVLDIAKTTGILLDPVYTGKAVHTMLKEMQSDPEKWRGRKVLFLHTGGAFGLYGSKDQLQGLVERENKVHRMTTS